MSQDFCPLKKFFLVSYKSPLVCTRDWHTFSVKLWIAKIFGVAGYFVSVITQLGHVSVKAAIDSIETHGCGCVLITLFIKNRGKFRFDSQTNSL